MATKQTGFSNKQLLFNELFVGTLIYCVVLGFFNDYTSVVYAKSFSTIFMASIVLELLTYLAFILKDKVIHTLKHRRGRLYRILRLFSVWFILFVSKFVFIWVIDILFGSNIMINGFFGILYVVVSVTIIHTLAKMTFNKLAVEHL